jgi:Cu-processing system permease protein
VRDRILYNLIVFVLLITASAIFLGELSGGKGDRVIVNIGLSAILFIGAFIAIFVGVSLVWKEIEKKTVYAIFAKPVGRSEFIIGKYLGLVATLFCNVAVMGVGLSLALLWVGNADLALAIWPATALIFLELSVITAIAIMFSSFSTPALSAMLTFMMFIIGHFSTTLRTIAGDMPSEAARAFFGIIYYGLPNFAHFSFITETANGLVAPMSMVIASAGYALVFIIILLSITVVIFSRRNFK